MSAGEREKRTVGRMTVRTDEAGLRQPAKTGIDPGGLSPRREEHDDESEGGDDAAGHHPGIDSTELARIGLVALAAAAVWFRLWEPLPNFSVIGLLATVIGGYPIFTEAFENIAERNMTMELSMTIALGSALLIGESFTALVITLFVLLAEVLERLTVSRGRRAIKDLLDFLPRTTAVRRGDAVVEVSIEEIRAGNVVVVNPGGRIPVDGSVVSGHSFVDQATITGESMPVEKTAGAMVYAGTINQSGALDIRTERLGRDTSFGKIIEAVEQAERSRAPIQKLADRLAGYLVYFAIAAAALTFLITRDVRSTISVIIVAGACGIAAGTPLAVLGAIGRAAREGAIVKGGRYLETLARVDTVVLDKTGTLSYGVPEVQGIHPLDGASSESLLQAAGTAELRSEHPLGKAILKRAADLGVAVDEPDKFEYTPGRGVVVHRGRDMIVAGSRVFLEEQGTTGLPLIAANTDGATQVLVASNRRLLGSIAIADRLRPEAKTVVDALKRMRIKTVLLTGDADHVARAVGHDLGVEQIDSEVLPDAKMQHVKALVEAGRTVAMVGDGVNDAPALMQASVGIAMGSGTDVARESAGIVLLGNDLLKFVETVQIARRARRTIMQNFAGTLVVDGVGVGLAAFGLLNPLLAAFVHVASEMVFILNSARLLPGVARE
jgi:heavy metal translocating P-type ATPase